MSGYGGIEVLDNREEFFAALYRDNFQKLCCYATAVLRNSDLAEEVVQDAFKEALIHCDVLMAHPKPEAWMMQTVKYKILKCRRDYERDAALLAAYEAVHGNLEASAGAVVEARVGMEETTKTIHEALTRDELHLLRRLALDKASHKVVARELDISVSLSQKRLERIRDKLAPLFPGYRKKK